MSDDLIELGAYRKSIRMVIEELTFAVKKQKKNTTICTFCLHNTVDES